MSTSGPPSFPPPPPNLTPPPGYVGYEPTLAGAVPLQRVHKLRTALYVLLAAVAVGNVIVFATTPAQVDAAREFIAGTIDEDTFTERQAGNAFAQLFVGAATIAIVVLTMIWLHRIAKNHRTLGRRITWGPGWAIGGWFLPPVLYVIPTLTLREHWKAADPAVPPGDDRWRSGPEPVLVYVWFLLYSVIPVALAIAGAATFLQAFGQDADDLADALVDTQAISMISAAVTVAAAVAWFLVVRGLTDRHVALTGETARR
ncbi:MAG: DUF4328 domain-containing protein [Actinomycetota bacterium]|nr:DUF4328 domain-containing protein [Actinomycetota bacterium]